MGIRFDATRDLARRYWHVLKHAWREAKDMDTPKRLPHELQFMPAALALQETPVHPAPRVTMWLLIAFALLALLWATFGKMDIVATATGKIIPNDRTKVIQSLEPAVVKAIHVGDGQLVSAGELLIELDATSAHADTERLSADVLATRFEVARARAMLDAIDGRPLRLSVRFGVSDDRFASERRNLEGQHAEYVARVETLAATISRRDAEIRAIREVVDKLGQTAPIARQRASDANDLLNNGFIPRHTYLQLEQAAIEQEHEFASQKAKLEEAVAALNEANRQKESMIAETRRLNLDRLKEAEQKVAALEQELIKAEQRQRLMRLVAPVDGVVQQLAVHTIGGVVTAAQPLMAVVPLDNPLEVEAFIANKDIGFVYPEQEAQVKIETFPFTKYGTIHGKVQHVSSDAMQDEKLGLVYTARVKLERDTVRVEEKTVNLSPGMAVTVEIKTGTRRIIEYFLSPLIQYTDESLRER